MRAELYNQDRSIVVRIRFAREVRGDLVVSIDPRRATGLRLVNEHRPTGEDRNWVAAGAFTNFDHGAAARQRSRSTDDPTQLPCDGFKVHWRAGEPVVVLTMPSRCLNDGDYGAVRFAVLTEHDGGDTDYAPDGRPGVSGWAPRG